MAVTNKEIAKMLNEVADLLDLKAESSFRVRSYRDAARTISGMSSPIISMAGKRKQLEALPGLGTSMAEKIEEIATTGRLSQLEELRHEIPSSLIEIMKLEQLGPRRTRLLHDRLNINTIDELQAAAHQGRIEKLKGFGQKTSENILREIEQFAQKGGSTRMKLHDARQIAELLLDYLRPQISDITLAGSLRRGKETVGDIDLVGSCSSPDAAMEHFTKHEDVERVLSKGDTRSSVKLKSGLQADLRIVEKKAFGAALMYFTGSQAHTVALRKLSQEKGFKMNEYGLFNGKRRLASETEKKMYNALGMEYIEPELREDKGEIEAASQGTLPHLISTKDILGDLHTHTNATDGRYSLEEMARAATRMGYQYYAVSDHSKKVAMAHGMDSGRLAEQIQQIDALNKKIKNLKIIKAIEVDILEDGRLDLPDDILKELDMVICAVHYNRNLSKERQTRRIIRALESPWCNILAHPTGRMIGKRSAYEVDMIKIMQAAKENSCFLEINSNPSRLDLNDMHIRQARDMGLKLSVSTDAHTLDNLNNMIYGVMQARRGWLTREEVINTLPWKELKKLFKKS